MKLNTHNIRSPQDEQAIVRYSNHRSKKTDQKEKSTSSISGKAIFLWSQFGRINHSSFKNTLKVPSGADPFKEHFKKICRFPLERKTIAIATPILITALWGVSQINMKKNEEGSTFSETCLKILAAFGAFFCALWTLSKIRSGRIFKEPLRASIRLDPDLLIKQRTLQHKEEIKHLRNQIKKIDTFILSHPDLKEISLKTLENYALIYGDHQLPSTDHLNPNDPIERLTILGVKKVALKCALEERKVFIQSNPDVLNSFLKHMHQEEIAAV